MEAGMDDVVTKPLDLTSLRRTLRRYLDTSPPPAEPAATAEPSPQPAAPPPGPEGRPVLSERARSATLVNLFLTQVPQQIEGLKGALEKAERGALGAAAHKLKGSAGSFGAPRMADVCAALQRGCHDAPVSALGGLVAEVESEFRLVEARLRELREKVSAA
jgi:HPt (histidine-containing phosphotransfer) domain-containing protein